MSTRRAGSPRLESGVVENQILRGDRWMRECHSRSGFVVGKSLGGGAFVAGQVDSSGAGTPTGGPDSATGGARGVDPDAHLRQRRAVTPPRCLAPLPAVLALALFVIVGGSPARVRAQDPAAPHALSYDLPRDLAITGGAAALWVATELLKGALAPEGCRWCEPPGFDAAARDALRWRDGRGLADTLSYVTALGLAPVLVFGLDALAAHDAGALGGFWVDALVVAEATALAMALNQSVKFLVGRERPFVHALPESEKRATAVPADNDLSFYSGHTAFPFALAVAAGTVATQRGYRLAPAIWASGLALASVSGYLRIAADKHYLSDVLTGAVLGAAVGVAVPLLLHGRRARAADGGLTSFGAAPLAGGAMVSASFVW